MARFIYYQIEGFLPSSFISISLGNNVKYKDRQKAIDTLENVLKRWKEERNGEYFNSNGELVNDNIYDDQILGYKHQFAFKNKRTGMLYELTFRVVKHIVSYNEQPILYQTFKNKDYGTDKEIQGRQPVLDA